MLLNLYLWLWPRLHPGYLWERVGRPLVLAGLVLSPLLYLNLDLMKKGYRPSRTSLTIQAGQPDRDRGSGRPRQDR